MTDTTQIKKVEKLKKALERIAFASLIIDIAISVVTVISLDIGQEKTIPVIIVLNYLLTIIVALSLVVFIAIVLFSHYDSIAEKLLLQKQKTYKRRKPPKHN